MKNDKNLIATIILMIVTVLFMIWITVFAVRYKKTTFEDKLKKIGLTPTEVKYIYEDKDGNIWHCVPESGYRQEVIERM